MKYIIPVALILAIFVAPAFALNQVNVTTCADINPISANTVYDLQNSITDCGSPIDLGGGAGNNIKINLHGFTFKAGSHIIQATSGSANVQSIEIFNGTLDSSIVLTNGIISNINLHDLIMTGCAVAGAQFNVFDFNVQNVNFLLNGSYNCVGSTQAVIGLFFGDATYTNVTATCTEGTCNDIVSNNPVTNGKLTLINTDLRNLTGTPSSIAGATVTLENSHLASDDPSFYASQTNSFDLTWQVLEPATLSAVDQHNAPINAMAEINGANGGGNQAYGVFNPTQHEIAGLNNGLGIVMLTKNITAWTNNNKQEIDLSTYNITVKSRSQSNSKLVTFHSPAAATFILKEPETDWWTSFVDAVFGKAVYAQENFSLDFSSEDAGGNITIDNRTATQKVTNDITGFTITIAAVGLIVFIAKAAF